MSTDNIAGELTQLNEHLGDIANALHKLVNLGKEAPQTFGDLIKSLPDPHPECEPCIDMEHQKARAGWRFCPECEPCIDMEHQKGYK